MTEPDYSIAIKASKRMLEHSPGDLMRIRNCSYKEALELQKLAKAYLDRFDKEEEVL